MNKRWINLDFENLYSYKGGAITFSIKMCKSLQWGNNWAAIKSFFYIISFLEYKKVTTQRNALLWTPNAIHWNAMKLMPLRCPGTKKKKKEKNYKKHIKHYIHAIFCLKIVIKKMMKNHKLHVSIAIAIHCFAFNWIAFALTLRLASPLPSRSFLFYLNIFTQTNKNYNLKMMGREKAIFPSTKRRLTKTDWH